MYHCETSLLHTERVRETDDDENTRSPIGRCLGWNDAWACRKSSWLPEVRKRLGSHINGESSRVTKCRMVRKTSDQAERKRKSVAKKADTIRERLLLVKERTLF